jgi:hypothetical protein
MLFYHQRLGLSVFLFFSSHAITLSYVFILDQPYQESEQKWHLNRQDKGGRFLLNVWYPPRKLHGVNSPEDSSLNNHHYEDNTKKQRI